jgi:DNA polymerase I - 3''-5'' exonuclease and polymerase domains
VTVLKALKAVLESTEYPKVFQNSKFDRLVFRCQGIKLTGVVFDTMLASYVLNPEARHSLEEIYIRYLINVGINLQSYNDVVSKNQTISDLDIFQVADYCGTQVFVTFKLVEKLRIELEEADRNKSAEKSLYRLLVDVEQPLESVLADMEFQGIRIDIEYLKKFSIQLKQDLEAIEKRACQTVDRQILQEHLQAEIHQIDFNSFTNQQELKKQYLVPYSKHILQDYQKSKDKI